MQSFACETQIFCSAPQFEHIERAALLRYFFRPEETRDERAQHAGETGDNSNARPFGVPTMSAMPAASAAHKPRPVRPITAQELAAAADPDAQLRISVVCALTSLGASTIRNMVKAGTFPAPAHFNQRTVRWRSGDVRAWIHERADPLAPK